jgi:gamma-butyrobetaine dioxygenase
MRYRERVEEIVELYARRSATQYVGEAVTVLAHSLQCAELARRASAPDVLVAAALLHDVGHLLHAEGEDCALRGLDARHEHLGADWIEHRLGPQVAQPIRLHVDAKRYLCGASADYSAQLSDASTRSLALQGGALAGAGLQHFREQSGADHALRLRAWDDQAKVPDAPTPAFAEYAPLLRSLAQVTRTDTRDR